MPRFEYPVETKAKILQVVQEARANDRGWDEALMLAKSEGYKGSLGGLTQFVRNATKKQKAAAPVSAAPKRKPGRPKKIQSVDADVGSMDTVQAMINGIVQQRLAAAFAKIRAALDEAEKGV